MANTYTQIHIQVVFAAEHRKALVDGIWEDQLYKYITGILQNYGHKMIQINGMPDHMHILFGMRPMQALSVLMQQIKQDSSKWINQNGFTNRKFAWQQGYGAFSYSKSQLPKVIQYIKNQKELHRKIRLRQEYMDILRTYAIDFDEQFIFKSIH